MNQAPKRRGRPPKVKSIDPLDIALTEIRQHQRERAEVVKIEPTKIIMTADCRQIGGTHYTSKSIQPWDAMGAWMSKEEFVGFLRGNALKYLARCNDKGGVEDVKKAQHYIEKLLEVLGA